MPVLFRWMLFGFGACAVAGGARAEDVPWRLDRERSSIDIAVHASSTTFMCRITRFDADLASDRASGQIDRAVVGFALVDAKTGQVRRDADLLEWADQAQFPRVSFHLSELTPTGDGGAQARGTVTWHGVEKMVTFAVRLLTQGRLQSIDGEMMLDYRDYGLAPIRRFLVVTVDPRLWVRFHLQGWLETALDGDPSGAGK